MGVVGKRSCVVEIAVIAAYRVYDDSLGTRNRPCHRTDDIFGDCVIRYLDDAIYNARYTKRHVQCTRYITNGHCIT